MTSGTPNEWLVRNGLGRGRGEIGVERRILSDGTVSGSTLSKCDMEPELPPMKDVQVVIAHVNTLNDFYVIRKSDLESLDKLNMDLSSVLSFGALDLYRHDDKNRRRSVAVYSYAPQKWKRLVYLAAAGGGTCKARYIDHGDIDFLDISELKLLPSLFEKVAPFAFHCSMDIVPAQGEVAWAEDLILTLRNHLDASNAPSSEQLDGGGLQARCLRKENGLNVVVLHAHGGKDWGSLLVDSGLAQRATSDTITKNGESDLDTPGDSEITTSTIDRIAVSTQNQHDFSAVGLELEQSDVVQKLSNVELKATKPEPSSGTQTLEIRAYPYTSEKLTPAPALSTGSSKKKYRILSVFDMDHFYIRQRSSEVDENCSALWDKLYSILVTGSATKLEYPPRICDVVLAFDHSVPSAMKAVNPYFRGVVTRVISGTHYEVVNIDDGKFVVVNETAMFKMTKKLFSIPVVGCEVFLYGVKKDPELILQSDFNACMLSLRETSFQLKLKCLKTGVPVVFLKASSDSLSLAETINGLAKWPWENILDLDYYRYRSDKEIIERGGPVYPATPLLDLPMSTEFKIIVKAVACSDADLLPFIKFEAMLPEFQSLKNVLFNQCERYLQDIASSPHCPSGREVVFLLPPPGEIGAGHLQRVLRDSANSDLYYCFDTGVAYHTDNKQGFVFRKMAFDFARIPHLLADGTVYGFVNNPSSRKIFQETFQVGREVSIFIREVVDDTMFKFECLEYETKARELGLLD